MSLEQLLSTYGYAAIAIGTFLEGETILVMGGFAAHRGYLELPGVLASAFLGSFLGDQLYFHVGRAKGPGFLEKRPGWKARSEKVFLLLRRHQTWLILGFRFLYGLRTVTPFVIGASGIAPLRFLVLNGLGALIWAAVVGVMGYLFGQALEGMIGDLKRYELWLFIGLAVSGVILGGTQMRKRIVAPVQKDSAAPDDDWLNLERLAEVEISSEDAAHPIESALLPGGAPGWRAAEPGKQTLRLVFGQPQRLRRIWLDFVETRDARSQEYVLRWSADGGRSFREIVRQQWNFSPQGSPRETEDHRVELPAVTVLELSITPDTSGGSAPASLAQLRLA